MEIIHLISLIHFNQPSIGYFNLLQHKHYQKYQTRKYKFP
jgi:hypothetical protein